MKRMMSLAVTIAVVLLNGVSADAANVVTMKSGTAIPFKEIRYKESSREYVITDAKDIIRQVPKADVEKIDIDKPPAMAKAEQMVASGQANEAVAALNDIISKFNMCVWDTKARQLLVKIYYGKQQYKEATALLKKMIENTPADEIPLTLLRDYWKSLIDSDQQAELKKELDRAAGNGARDVMAVAQLMRANTALKAGQKEDALLDFLRVVLLFEDVKEVQAEALFNAADVMEGLKDPRATEMRKRIIQQYPDSEYAKKLAGKV